MSGFGSDGWYESLLKLLPLLLASAAAASPSVDVGISSGWKKVEKDEQPRPMMGTEVGRRPCSFVFVVVVAFLRPPNGRRGHLDGDDDDDESSLMLGIVFSAVATKPIMCRLGGGGAGGRARR